jgi:CDP-2,3-bis-(O-geranylgeranyl)-sn-glycerol synthase
MSRFEPLRLGLWGVQALYLFAPLIVSAALAGIVLRYDWLPGLNRPLDGRATFRGQRVFGDGKTWRGALIAIGGSSLSVALQRALQESLPRAIQVVDYSAIPPIAFGASLGLGAILGELPNSLVKRQLRIPRGETTHGFLGVVFYVWDQVDTLIGAWPLLGLWFTPSVPLVIMSFALTLGLHPLIAWLGYLAGARRSAR